MSRRRYEAIERLGGELPLCRRTFLRGLVGVWGAWTFAGGALWARASQPLPVRRFGRTGVVGPILGLGTAPLGVQRASERRFRAVVAAALEVGVRWFDTAPNYGPAERYLSASLRDVEGVWVITKVEDPSRRGAWCQIDASRKRLGRDVLDAVLIHNVGAFPPELLRSRAGAWTALLEAKARGTVRWIGVAGHYRPGRFLWTLDDPAIDIVQVPVNYVDRHTYRFEARVVAPAWRRGIAVFGSQPLGGARAMRYERPTPALLAGSRVGPALRYAVSVPGVSCVLLGAATPAEIRHAVALLQERSVPTQAERRLWEVEGPRLARAWGAHLGPVDG